MTLPIVERWEGQPCMRCDAPASTDVLVMRHEPTRRIAVLCTKCIAEIQEQGADAMSCYAVPDRALN
jgi:hypothetical protein